MPGSFVKPRGYVLVHLITSKIITGNLPIMNMPKVTKSMSCPSGMTFVDPDPDSVPASWSSGTGATGGTVAASMSVSATSLTHSAWRVKL